MNSAGQAPPRVTHVLETALYVDDLARSADFYRATFGLEALVDTPRLVALDVSGRDVLLLFQRGATVEGLKTDSGWIPPHDGSGPSHFAFAIEREDLERWVARLAALDIAIESRTEWERGGTSLYFRDPDGHSVELVTPRTWATY